MDTWGSAFVDAYVAGMLSERDAVNRTSRYMAAWLRWRRRVHVAQLIAYGALPWYRRVFVKRP